MGVGKTIWGKGREQVRVCEVTERGQRGRISPRWEQ